MATTQKHLNSTFGSRAAARGVDGVANPKPVAPSEANSTFASRAKANAEAGTKDVDADKVDTKQVTKKTTTSKGTR